MKFRIISEAGAYMSRAPGVMRLELSDDRSLSKAFPILAPMNELLPVNTIVEGSHIIPGPHLEPLDPEAEAAMAAYRRERPGASLDPTRSLPLTGGFDTIVQGQLNRLLAGVEAKPQQQDEMTALRQQVVEMRAMLEKMMATPPVPAAAPAGRRGAT